VWPNLAPQTAPGKAERSGLAPGSGTPRAMGAAALAWEFSRDKVARQTPPDQLITAGYVTSSHSSNVGPASLAYGPGSRAPEM
jgi:hypothetical protein